jgi:hypothetical protein
MAKIRSKQILADATPINPYDVANKEYVDSLIGSGGTALNLTIQDEGSTLSNNVNVINFIGNSVKAKVGDNGRIDVYIPSPNYTSHFNTQDGTTNALISDINTTLRYIATPTTEGTPYKIGNWISSPTISQKTIRNNVTTLSYSTNSAFTVYDSGSTYIVAQLIDVDGVTVLNTSTQYLNSNRTTSAQGITITTSNFTLDADRYSAKITVLYNISSILPQGGRFSIKITHYNSIDGTYTYTQNDIFRDSEALTLNLNNSTLSLTENNKISKYISGVEYYTTNTTWSVNINNINNLNSRSYPITPQLIISGNSLFSNTIITVNGVNNNYLLFTSGWTNKHDNSGVSFSYNNWVSDIINQSNWNNSANTINPIYLTALLYDWSLIVNETSTTYNYLINTYVDNSTRNFEDFISETNLNFPRLHQNLTTSWNSTVNLNLEDDGLGLQLLNNRLVYPTNNFSIYNPDSLTQPDYSLSTSARTYIRKFNTNGYTISNGIIQLSDHNLTESDLANDDIKFEISIDSGISWFIIKSNYIGGILTNGSDCRTNKLDYGLGVGNINSNALSFTLGQGGASTYVYLKITYSGTSTSKQKYIGGINFTGGNWN